MLAERREAHNFKRFLCNTTTFEPLLQAGRIYGTRCFDFTELFDFLSNGLEKSEVMQPLIVLEDDSKGRLIPCLQDVSRELFLVELPRPHTARTGLSERRAEAEGPFKVKAFEFKAVTENIAEFDCDSIEKAKGPHRGR